MHDLIDSTEMYLRTVLELEEEGIPALRARLAERLGLSAPSVSEGVARLEREGLVELADDRTVELTAEGRERATHVMRKHRLAERLLLDVIGLEPEHVHAEACRWEHVISDRVEEKLIEFLGNPSTSPYGNPIPGAEQHPELDIVTLADVGGGQVRLERISEQLQGDNDVIAAMDASGIRAGQTLQVVRDHAGSLVVAHDGNQLEVEDAAARLIYVTPLG